MKESKGHPVELQKILTFLDQSQWVSTEQLQSKQFVQLKKLLHHASTTVPFYKHRFSEMGIDPDKIEDFESWQQLPMLSRDDIQAAGVSLNSDSIPLSHGSTTSCSTSGSTGKPVRVLKTGLCSLLWNAITIRDHLWHSRDFSKPLVAIRYFPAGTADYPQGLKQANWGSPAALLYATGPSSVLTIQSSIEQQLEWLKRQQHGYLLTYPTNLEALARECLQANVDISGLIQIRTVAEALDKQTRELCRHAWDTPVVDVYSTQEVGYIALQCPIYEHYHAQEETVMVEVLNDDGKPCSAGEIGRVVVTPLHNYATPLIRYDIGDYAEVGPPCPCGRGLTVLKRIMGRVRNMIRLPNGEQYWPIIHHDEIMNAAPIKQFRIIQRTIDTIEFDIVANASLTSTQEQLLIDLLQTHLRFPFEIQLNYKQVIQRNSAGKFEDFMSLI